VEQTNQMLPPEPERAEVVFEFDEIVPSTVIVPDGQLSFIAPPPSDPA
jgi:hypothetical protein